MAVTRISDVIVPDVFTAYMLKETTEKAAVFQSGLVVADGHMADMIGGAGLIYQHPFWTDLANVEPNVASDDPTVSATPNKIGTAKFNFIKNIQTQGWSSAQLVRELNGDDPQQRIVSRVSAYWSRYFNRVTVSTLTGILNSNVANNAGDMVKDISALTGTTTIGGVTTNAYNLNADAILEAKQTMGDMADELKIIVMHSRVYTNLQKQNLIAFIPTSDGRVNVPTYLGYEVLVTDTVPAVTVASDIIYTTYLAAPGVVGFAEVPVEKPVEFDYFPAKANGMGVEEMWTRRQFSFHPYGFNWKDASRAGNFPTRTEIELAANWDRKFPERKQVGLVAIKSKNG